MITLTAGAIALITLVVGQRPEAADGGLRIAATDTGLDVSFVSERRPGDEVVERAGARVYLDGAAAAKLAGKTLDGRVDDTGKPSFDVIG